MSNPETNVGVAPNVGGLLCYVPCCVGLIFSIVVAIVEKQSKFVRFHAFQSLLLHGAMFVLWIGFMVLGMVVGSVAGPLALILLPIEVLCGLALLALTIFLMIKANGNEEYKLPVIGDMAKGWV
ncbi:MAG: DUF4870 domain-containing protein [Vicinamibacteria bacterium]